MPDFHFAGGVQGHFLENIVGWADALEAIRLARTPDDSETTASLGRVARAISGSAGLYGYPEVQQYAATLERSVVSGREATVNEAAGNLIAALHEVVDDDPDHKIRILIIEPDADATDLLAVMLSTPNREVTVASSRAEAQAALEERDVSLIILALDLPDADGRTLLLELRGRVRTAAVPILVLSPRGEAQIKTECFALGADAFFEKPFDPAVLSSAVSVRLQRRASTQSRDPVTGLPDRTAFENAYERVQSSYPENTNGRYDGSSAESLFLGALSPDHFGEVMDVHGPAAGEEVLRHTSDLALRSLRDADLIARWDEQTFSLLFPGLAHEEAADALDRLVQTIRQAAISTMRDEKLSLSCSAGLVRVRDPRSRPLDDAWRDATYFLQRAQQRGGRRVETEENAGSASPSRPEILLVEDDELIATILKDRLEREAFVVHHFADGKHAYEYAQDHDAALALLDVKVPGMDGFELLKQLRAMPAYARCPILMLTAMSREEDVVRGFDLGADDYILKPFSPDELVARIRRLIS